MKVVVETLARISMWLAGCVVVFIIASQLRWPVGAIVNAVAVLAVWAALRSRRAVREGKVDA